MQVRWMLSQFYTDSGTGMPVPVCSAYSATWLCPTIPAEPDGWALVQTRCDPHQVEAAAQDDRVLVCPLTFDPAPLDSRVTGAYSSWGATTGMSIGALLAKLAATEPVFGQTWG